MSRRTNDGALCRTGKEYAGVVAAFTAPIVMIQPVTTVADKRTAALSRIEQTLIGIVAVVVVINVMWRSSSLSSHQVRCGAMHVHVC